MDHSCKAFRSVAHRNCVLSCPTLRCPQYIGQLVLEYSFWEENGVHYVCNSVCGAFVISIYALLPFEPLVSWMTRNASLPCLRDVPNVVCRLACRYSLWADNGIHQLLVSGQDASISTTRVRTRFVGEMSLVQIALIAASCYPIWSVVVVVVVACCVASRTD